MNVFWLKSNNFLTELCLYIISWIEMKNEIKKLDGDKKRNALGIPMLKKLSIY